MIPSLLTVLCWSLGAVAANQLTRAAGSVPANFWRLAIAAVFLALYAFTSGGGVGGGAFRWFFASGAVGFGFGDIALYYALSRLGSRLTVLMVLCVSAPLAAVLEWAWLGTTLGATQLAAGALILGGVGAALAPGSHAVPHGQLGSGVFFGSLAAIGQAGGAVLSVRGYQALDELGTSIDGLTAAHQRVLAGVAISGLWLVMLALRGKTGWWARLDEHGRTRPPGGGWRFFWQRAVTTALLGPVIGVACYQWALSVAPSGVVLAVVATTPLAVMPFSWLWEGDRPGPRALLGAVVAVAGVVWLTVG